MENKNPEIIAVGHPELAKKETWFDWLSRQGANWRLDPEKEKSPIVNLKDKDASFVESSFVNLRLIPNGSVIYFRGSHVTASHWTIKKTENDKLKLWRDTEGRTTGLMTEIGNFSVFDRTSSDDNKVGNTYDGAIAGGKGMKVSVSLPYFKYDPNGNVLEPDDGWFDEIKTIYLKTP